MVATPRGPEASTTEWIPSRSSYSPNVPTPSAKMQETPPQAAALEQEKQQQPRECGLLAAAAAAEVPSDDAPHAQFRAAAVPRRTSFPSKDYIKPQPLRYGAMVHEARAPPKKRHARSRSWPGPEKKLSEAAQKLAASSNIDRGSIVSPADR